MPAVGSYHAASSSAPRADQTIELAQLDHCRSSETAGPALPGEPNTAADRPGIIVDAVRPVARPTIEAIFIPMPPQPVMGQVAPPQFQHGRYAADNPMRAFFARRALCTIGSATLFITIMTAFITKSADRVHCNNELNAVRGNMIPQNNQPNTMRGDMVPDIVASPVIVSPRSEAPVGAPVLSNAAAAPQNDVGFGSLRVEEKNQKAFAAVLGYACQSALTARAIEDMATSPSTTFFAKPTDDVHFPSDLQVKAQAGQLHYVEIADPDEETFFTPAGQGKADECRTISAAAQTVRNILQTHGEISRPFVSALFAELPDAVHGSFNQRRLNDLLRQEAPQFNETVGAAPVGWQRATDTLSHGECSSDAAALRAQLSRAAHHNDTSVAELVPNAIDGDVSAYGNFADQPMENTRIPSTLIDQAYDLQIAFAQHSFETGRAALRNDALTALLARDHDLHEAAYKLGFAIDTATNATSAALFYPRSVLQANAQALGPVSARGEDPVGLFPPAVALDRVSATPAAPAGAEAPATIILRATPTPRPTIPRPPIVRP